TWPPKTLDDPKFNYTPLCDVWAVGAIIHNLAHTFSPVVSTIYVRNSWPAKGNTTPYPKGWSDLQRKRYWAAKAPRRVVPINLEPSAPLSSLPSKPGFDPIAATVRKRRPCLKYSDWLNDCMMRALEMDARHRICTGALWHLSTAAHVDHLLWSFDRGIFVALLMTSMRGRLRCRLRRLRYCVGAKPSTTIRNDHL
ncbi:hypothetical protein T440DRAFT_111733, partial [Plenodomus tracheiphilus IPT5]